MGELIRRRQYSDEVRLIKARAYLADVFPDASMVQLAEVHPIQRDRLLRAGLDIAEVHVEGSEPHLATFIVYRTAHTEALELIWLKEQGGMLPEGSHGQAIDAIQNGEFKRQWGAYFPGQET